MTNPRDVTLDLVARDQTEKATRSAADNLDKLSRKVKDVDDANKMMGSRAGGHLRRLSDSLRGAATQLDRYKRKAGDADDANLSLGRRAAGHLRRMSRSVDDAADRVDRLRREVDDVDKANESMGRRAAGHFRKLGGWALNVAKAWRTAGPLVVLALIAAALSALPSIAYVAGAGIVLGLGGALAFLGLKFAAKNKEVKKSFTDLKAHVVKEMTEMSAVFKPTLLGISKDMRESFDGFGPNLDAAFQQLAPVVRQFSTDLFRSLERLKPAIEPVVDAFEVLLREIGAGLPGLMTDLATAFIHIADAIKDNPQAIRDLIAWLGDLLVIIGKVIGTLIRMPAYIEAAEASFDVLMTTAVASFATIMAKAADMAAGVLEALARIPGPGQGVFRLLASVARGAATDAQRHLDQMNVDKLEAEIRHGVARLRVLGNMKPTPQVTAEIEDLKRKIAHAKVILRGIKDRTIDVWVREHRKVYYGKGVKPPTNPQGDSAGGVGFALTAPGGWMSRTGGPAVPDVYATTYVTLDGREIAAAVRTVIDEATGRQSFRARSGRR